MIPILLTLLQLTLVNIPDVKYEPPYFVYMEVKSEDSTAYKVEFGSFHLNEDQRVTKDKAFTSDRNIFVNTLDSVFQELPEDHRNILIYIHGMWAHKDFFQEEVLTKIRADALNGGESPYGLVVSVIWHSGMNYFDNSKHALAVGKYYSSYIQDILNLNAKEISVMCHSMGNRVFQGVLTQVDENNFKDPPFSKALLIAADLEENIFESGQPLQHVDKYVTSPIIYVHNNDRSLGMSRALNENDRLGLNADDETILANPSLQIIDVSTVDDNEGFGPSLSNHRYFYTSPTVRKDLYFSLHGKENPQRITLNNNKRLKLKKQ